MDNTAVYDKFDWSKINHDFLKGKIEKIIEWIPEDVQKIVDIGCGNGVITNVLGSHYDVTAVDRSKQALESVETRKLSASADSIPLPDQSFDMVFSSELLEHLNDNLLKGTIAEVKRLSKKYVFITVPNDENPDKLSIRCPECKYVYNSPNHLRRFKASDVSSLFPEYKILKTLAFGSKVRYYNPTILKIKKSLTHASSWIPKYWIEESKRNSICPNCENEFNYPYKFNPIATGLDIINVILSPKKPCWLFVLMEKK